MFAASQGGSPYTALRGLLGVAEPILTAGGRAMRHYREYFVGIDVAKARNAISVAEDGREGEVRFVGEVDTSEASMRRVVKQIAAKCDCVQFCYEAGPTGYGLLTCSRDFGPLET
jgi:transposase